MAFRIFAGVLFVLAILMGFGWLLDQDSARATGLVAAGMLTLLLSSVPIGPVP
jgi:hypothetical protein